MSSRFALGWLFLAATIVSTFDYQPALAADPEDSAALKKYFEQPIFDLPFRVTRPEWTDEDEERYSEFVYTVGKGINSGRCGKITACMRDPKVNPYADRDPEGIIFYVDCAKLPYLLRAYFAYHNGLPFSFVTGLAISQRPYASLPDRDSQLPTAKLENSPYGNIIRWRGGASVPRSAGRYPNFQKYLMAMVETVSTRTQRVGPLSPNYNLSDYYPVAINRDGIRPGTIVAANGHTMVVWNVDAKGMVHIISGHPGAYVQHHVIDRTKLQRSRPDHGFGFYRFRPMRVDGASVDASGSLFGGRVVTASDQELYSAGKYSLAQWFGPGSQVAPGSQVDPNAWKRSFSDVDFFDYLARQLRKAGSVQQAFEAPVLVFKGLCTELRARAKTVSDGIAQGLGRMAHPEALPANIFGASDANWEAYATPSADGRIKDAVRNALRTSINQYRIAKGGSPSIVFKGSAKDYQKTLRERLAKVAKSCSVSYVNSAGTKVTLSFNQVLARLNRMSFDPYMCPEKLWGASGAEMATCQDQDYDNRWYNAEQPIRNTVGKQVDGDDQMVVRSTLPITLEMLESGQYIDQPSTADIALGTRKVPLMNLDAYLASDNFIRALTE